MRRLLLSLLLFILLGYSPLLAQPYDKIKIQVFDQVITEKEVELRTQQALQSEGVSLTDPLAYERIKGQVIEGLIDEALLNYRAKELGIEVSEEQIDNAIEQYRGQRGISERGFEEALEQQQMTLADFRRTVYLSKAREALIQHEVKSQISINEEELKAKHLENSQTNTMVHARHILVLEKPDASDEAVKKASDKIAALAKKLASGADFARLAKTESEDPTAKQNGGDLGFFGEADMDPSFTKAAFALKPKQLSPPVRSRFGFHLIEVLATEKRATIPYEKVKGHIFNQEYQNVYQQKLFEYMDALRTRAKIRYR